MGVAKGKSCGLGPQSGDKFIDRQNKNTVYTATKRVLDNFHNSVVCSIYSTKEEIRKPTES